MGLKSKGASREGRGGGSAGAGGGGGGALSSPDTSLYDAYSATTGGFGDYNSSMDATRHTPSTATAERRPPIFSLETQRSPTFKQVHPMFGSQHTYGEGTPGPGTYSSSSRFGPQVLSYQQSPWFADFSKATRDQQNKIYLSSEFGKNKYGTQSPGPCVCDLTSSLGIQATAPNRTAPKTAFGGERRTWNFQSLHYNTEVFSF